MEHEHPLESMFLSKLNFVSVRLSRISDLTLENTQALVADYSHYIVSEEVSAKGVYHQHIVIAHENLNVYDITLKIKQIYPTAKGNKCIYVRPAEKPQQLIKYTLKEGKYITKGFSSQYIADAQKLSRSKENSKDQFIQLEEKLLLRQINFKQFQIQYIDLKVIHAQPLYDNHLAAYFRRMGIQSGHIKIEDYVERLNQSYFLGY